MTEFKQLELIYEQFENLTNQINKLISDELYQEANLKLNEKDKLIKKIFLTKKTVKFTEEEEQKIQLLDKQISENNQNLIKSLTKEHKKLAEELNSTKKRVKVNSAYEISTKSRTGKLVDTSE